MNMPENMQAPAIVGWVSVVVSLSFLMISLAYTIRSWRRVPLTRDEIKDLVGRRLSELLPLPWTGSRAALSATVDEIAPGRPLALFTTTEPPLLVASHGGDKAPGGEDARWVEIHRPRLALGQTVRDRCGTLIPALGMSGKLHGVVLVAGDEDVVLGERAHGALRYLAGLLMVGAALDESMGRERCRRKTWS
jgi:hypothetical protein